MLGIIIIFAVLIMGIILLVISSKIAVNNSASLAASLGVSSLIIGVTLVSIGTDISEIFNSIISCSVGHADISAGDTLGSNMTQITLVFGLLPLLGGIFPVKRKCILIIGSCEILSLIFIFTVIQKGYFTRFDGLLMILSLVFYLLVTYQITKKDIGKQVDLLIENTSQNQPQMEINLIDLLMEDGPKKQSKLELNRVASMIEDTSQNQLRERIRYVTLALLGFSGVTLSSYVIIQSIIFLSSQLNMSEYIISFFMVSIGTSLPELSVDVTAIKHKHYRIAMGDLIGSCIVDSTLAIGIGQFLFPQAISTVTAVPSIIYALFASLIVILIAAKREKIDKKAGIVFILLYLFSFPSIILIENYLFF